MRAADCGGGGTRVAEGGELWREGERSSAEEYATRGSGSAAARAEFDGLRTMGDTSLSQSLLFL